MAMQVSFPAAGTVFVRIPDWPVAINLGTVAAWDWFRDDYGWPSYNYYLITETGEETRPARAELLLYSDRWEQLRGIIRANCPAPVALESTEIDAAIVSTLDGVKQYGLARRPVVRAEDSYELELPLRTARVVGCRIQGKEVKFDDYFVFEGGYLKPKRFAVDIWLALEVNASPAFDWEAAGLLAATNLTATKLLGDTSLVFPTFRLGDYAQRVDLRELRFSLERKRREAWERLRQIQK